MKLKPARLQVHITLPRSACAPDERGKQVAGRHCCTRLAILLGHPSLRRTQPAIPSSECIWLTASSPILMLCARPTASGWVCK